MRTVRSGEVHCTIAGLSQSRSSFLHLSRAPTVLDRRQRIKKRVPCHENELRLAVFFFRMTRLNFSCVHVTNVWLCFWVVVSLRMVAVFSSLSLWMVRLFYFFLSTHTHTHTHITYQPKTGGSLDRVLWGGGSGTTISNSWIQRIQILLDVADGLTYLHLVHKSVHLDLKSPNILLEKIISNDDAARSDDSVTHRAKIADFGLSRIFAKGKTRINVTKETSKSSKKSIKAANWVGVKQKGFVGTPRWMAPEMMKGQVKFGPSADIYSFGVVMWEVWARRKPWSELSDKQEIFRIVNEEKKKLPSLEKEEDEVPDKYDDLMRRCCKYKANQRPLVDVVRDDLQGILEKAAEIDRERTLHLELTHEGSMARAKMILKMMEDDEETKQDSKSKKMRRQSSRTNRNRTDSRLRRHSTGSSKYQGGGKCGVQIEMGTFSSSSDRIDLIEEVLESKDNMGGSSGLNSTSGESPFKL